MIKTYLKYKEKAKPNQAIDMYFNLLRLGYIRPSHEQSLLDTIEADINDEPKELLYERVDTAA